MKNRMHLVSVFMNSLSVLQKADGTAREGNYELWAWRGILGVWINRRNRAERSDSKHACHETLERRVFCVVVIGFSRGEFLKLPGANPTMDHASEASQSNVQPPIPCQDVSFIGYDTYWTLPVGDSLSEEERKPPFSSSTPARGRDARFGRIGGRGQTGEASTVHDSRLTNIRIARATERDYDQG